MPKYNWKNLLADPAYAGLQDPEQKKQLLSRMWEDEYKDDPEVSGLDAAGREYLKHRFLSDVAPDLYTGGAQPAAPAEERPGFVGRWWEMVNPAPALKMAAGGIRYLGQPTPENLEATGIPTMMRGIGEQAKRGWQLGTEAQEKGQHAEALYRLGTAIPVVGPMMEQVGEDVRARNYPGLAGTIAGAATPFAAPRMMIRGGKVAKKLAISQYEKGIRPGRQHLREMLEAGAGDKPPLGPQMLEAGIKGTNLWDPTLRARYEMQVTGKAISAAEDALMGRSKTPRGLLLRTKPMKDRIMAEFKKATVVGRDGKPIPIPGKESYVKTLRDNLVAIHKIEDRSNRLPAGEIIKLRQAWDEVSAAQPKIGKYGIKEELTPQQLAYRHSADGARRLLRDATNLGPLWDLYGFWKDSYQILRSAYLASKTAPRGWDMASYFGRRAAVLGAFGATAHFGMSADWMPALAVGGVAVAADKLIRSPGWRMTSAVMKNRVANALFQPDAQLAMMELGHVANALNITLEHGVEQGTTAEIPAAPSAEEYDWVDGKLVPRSK